MREQKGSEQSLKSLIQVAGNTLSSRVLAPSLPPCLHGTSPDPTPVPTVPPPSSEAAALDKALRHTDVIQSLVDDVMSCARSPRTAVLRAKDVGYKQDSCDKEDDHTPEEENGSPLPPSIPLTMIFKSFFLEFLPA